MSGVVELSPEEGQALVERRVSELLGMSLAEFLCAYEAGELDDEDPDVLYIVMLLPFARRITGTTSPPATEPTTVPPLSMHPSSARP
jgi:hypothetical protein